MATEETKTKRTMRFHYHNLNEKKNGKRGSILRHGRAWFYFDKHDRIRLNAEWSVPTSFFHVCFSFGEPYEGTLQVKLACGLFAFWFTVEAPGWSWLPTRRRCEISFHHRTLWIYPWSKKDEWRSADPWWVRGLTINFEDLLFGRSRCETREISTHDVLIPMPEGCYPAKVTVQERTWTWPRRFAKSRTECSIDIPGGIPFEGKGENSWDCGEDGLYGCGSEGASIENAIGTTVRIVLNNRRRYGGRHQHRQLEPVIARQVNGETDPPHKAACP